MRSKFPLILGSLFLLTQPAWSLVYIFEDRAIWEADVGPMNFSENFNKRTVDEPFRTTPLTANGFTVRQEGLDRGFRNEVDVPPLSYLPDSDSAYLSLYVNYVQGDIPGTSVRFTFDEPTLAFGADFNNEINGEGVVMDVYNGGTLLASTVIGTSPDNFRGFLAQDGDAATSVVLRSFSYIEGIMGDGFSMDNISGASSVPEPSGAVFCLAGLAALGIRRRR